MGRKLLGNLPQAAADEVAKLTGGKTMAVAADVSKPEDVDAMMKAILDEFGTIDIAFNNAGICNADAPAEEMKYEEALAEAGLNLVDYRMRAMTEADYKKHYRAADEKDNGLSEEEAEEMERMVLIEPNRPLPFDTQFAVLVGKDSRGVEGEKTMEYFCKLFPQYKRRPPNEKSDS